MLACISDNQVDFVNVCPVNFGCV